MSLTPGYKLRTRPWWTDRAVRFVNSLLTKQSLVLEFGIGGSTPWLCRRARRVVSIEHNPTWYRLLLAEKLRNLTLWLLNRPYDGVCARFKDNTFDFIIVDGRDRVRCFKAALRLLKPGGWIGLDDAARPRYKPAWHSVRGWRQLKTKNPEYQTDEVKPGQRIVGSYDTWFWQKPMTG